MKRLDAVEPAAYESEGALLPREEWPHRCSRCIMPGTAAFLDLDEQGCRFCREFDADWPRYQFSEAQEAQNLQALADRIRRRRKRNSRYDAVIGLSGGVDSSYVALLTKQLGLKVLAVHFDNGWNSRTAVENIRRIVDACGMDLETYVINWPEFRDLQRAYIRAGVLDIEALTDHAITAVMFRLARRNGIRTVLSGWNFATEHSMPPGWLWPKQDLRNLRAIHRRFGEKKLRTFPQLGSMKWLFIEALGLGGHIEWPLSEINFRKTSAMVELEREFGWQYYGGKHYESTFTKFYQAYILPLKFGIDKRLVHLSSLVRNGEMTRDEALRQSLEPLYPADELRRDRKFVLKKLGFSEAEFDAIMAEPAKNHDDYPTDQRMVAVVRAIGRPIKKLIVG